MNYRELTSNQEQADLMPNQVVYHLAAFTGLPHQVAHRALLVADPTVIITPAGAVLAVDDLPAVFAALGVELLRGLAYS